MIWSATVSFVVSFSLIWLLLPLLRTWAIDVPNHRSSHTEPVPRAGGVAVVVGVLAACVVGALQRGLDAWPVVVGLLIMAAVGLADDLRSLTVALRLSVTLIVAGIVAGWIVSPENAQGWIAAVVATLFITGYTNVFNFMDGINGISSLSAACTGVWLALIFKDLSANAGMTLSVGIAFASLGFLPWNAPTARVFLGDCGSYALGFALAALGVVAWILGAPILLVIAPMWIYLVDTGSTFIRRLLRRERVFAAHREHVYQRLVDSHFSHLTVAGIVAGLGGLLCGVAMYAQGGLSLTAPAMAIVASLYLALPSSLSRIRTEAAAR